MSELVVRQRTRRGFIVGAFGALASYIPVARRLDKGPEGLLAWLQRLAAEVPAAAGLGRRYLEQRPAEASAAWLACELLGEELASGPADVDRLIAHRIRSGRESDYRSGNLVVLNGWFVTQTEARLMALLSLRTS